jgi:phospholipid/cholesterol/gamma-HCH transport system substrate-binding protein
MIAILPSYEGALAEPGDFLKGKVESDIFSSITNQLNPLQGIVEGLVKKLDKTVSGLNEVLDTESQKNLKNSFTNLNATIANFQAISSDVDKLISSNNQKFSKIISNLESGSNTFKNLSNELEKADLSSVVADIKGSLDSLNSTLSKLDSGKGTTGKLMNDEELYQNLTNASKELEELLREVKTNPKKFVHFSVFGKKQKQVD